jgi:hypothetical protein
VWKRRVDGKTLSFRLAGINNQNFIMRDEQTGSYWQQVSGVAISGPMKGRHLELVRVDELTFDLWRKESPQGTILAPTPYEGEYDPADWEAEMQKVPTVVSPDRSLPDRELVIGITHQGEDKAYPFARLREQKVIQDRLGGEPIIIALGPDNRSVRAFIARDKKTEKTIEFFRKSGEQWSLVDSLDGREWDFRGCVAADRSDCLMPVNLLYDYWFDWKLYHPQTAVYRH